ncbi:chloride channel protein [Caminibacter sp.]
MGLSTKKRRSWSLKIKRSILIDTFLIGFIGAVSAQVFLFLLDTVKKISNYINNNPYLIEIAKNLNISPSVLIVFTITLGGLISGFLVYKFAPEAEGHGTDTVIRAFHRTGGYLRPIVVPIKIIASAITIGTGGSAGKEGPTALFSAGIGSIYSDWKKVSWRDRQIYVLIAMASGLSAVFKAPLGTSFFAVEVLYISTEIESRDLIYILFGPLVAYTLTGYFFGWHPIFTFPDTLMLTSLWQYVDVVVLGIISGILGFFLPNIFYYTRDFFRSLKINPIFKPAIGAFFVGIIGIYLPYILGGGYQTIQAAIDGKLIGMFVLFLLLGKIAAFVLTVGSGGSGGVFAPTLFIGAMLGAFFASIFHLNIAVFVLIAMAAVFGAAARTPLASIIMVLEMSGGYDLLAPTMFGVLAAFVTHNVMNKTFKPKYVSLYEAQLLNSNFSVINQIEKLKDILVCEAQTFGFDLKRVKNDTLITLLENGRPIKVGENKYVFFGTFHENEKLELEGKFKKYKGAYVLYVFRNGEWLHAMEIDEIKKGDDVLLYGGYDTIFKIKDEFTPVSEIFSKLKLQEELIEKA